MEHLIEFTDIAISHEDHVVVSGLTVTVQPGEFLYLLGKTGSGKSSFLKALYADLPVSGSTARVCGFDLLHLRGKDIPYLRRKLGIVFQDFQLLGDRNIYSNLEFVMKATGWTDKSKIRTRISEVLTQVGLDGKEKKKPHELSGGEQQRVGIARALVNSPSVLLADEPTGNLDPETSEDILLLLRKLNATGCAVVFATHDMLLYNKFRSRTLLFDQGRVTMKN